MNLLQECTKKILSLENPTQEEIEKFISEYVNDNLYALNKLVKETRDISNDLLYRHKLKCYHELLDKMLIKGFSGTYEWLFSMKEKAELSKEIEKEKDA